MYSLTILEDINELLVVYIATTAIRCGLTVVASVSSQIANIPEVHTRPFKFTCTLQQKVLRKYSSIRKMNFVYALCYV